jgi:hypothetical protein
MKNNFYNIVLVGLNLFLIIICLLLNSKNYRIKSHFDYMQIDNEKFYEKRDQETIKLNNYTISNFINYCLASNNIIIQSDNLTYKILFLIIPPSPCNDCITSELELLTQNNGSLSHFKNIFIIASEERFKDYKSLFFNNEKISVLKYNTKVFFESDFDSILYIIKNENVIINIFLSNKRNVKSSKFFYSNIISL